MSNRAFHRLIAKVGIAAVLFAQLAVAAYACPVLTGTSDAVTAVVANDARNAMPGCSEMDTGNANLCLQHCQAGDQSVQTTPHAPLPAIALVPLAVVAQLEPPFARGIGALSARMERQTSPPPLIRFGVLRI